ncbi:hypothetical protein [Chromobacterium sp. CV08]|uniref:hypothetical protein n=1 Tax=Chromobacterium sp. CV08 TaxID=3133274 RepID=UPI003DA7DA31
MGISLADNISTNRASLKNLRKPLFFKQGGKRLDDKNRHRRARAAKLAACRETGAQCRSRAFSRLAGHFVKKRQ